MLARLVKLLTGVGPLVALMATPQAWSGPALLLFGVVTVAAAVRGREHRGLSHTLAGMDLEIVQPRAYEQVSRPG